MLEVVDQILTADSYTWYLAIVLMLSAAIIVHSMSQSMTLTVSYAPVLLVGALTSAWLFRTFTLLSDINQDVAVIIATAAGMVCALFPLLALTRFTGVLHDYFIKAPEHEIIVPRPSKMKKSVHEA